MVPRNGSEARILSLWRKGGGLARRLRAGVSRSRLGSWKRCIGMPRGADAVVYSRPERAEPANFAHDPPVVAGQSSSFD